MSASPLAAPAPDETTDQVAQTLLRAEQATRERRYGEADGICRDVLRDQPNHPAALGLRGSIAAVEGRVLDATALLESAIAIEPRVAAWHATLCELYRVLYRLDDALAAGRRALALDQDRASALVNLGKVHVDRDELDTALEHFLAALAVQPENANAHLGLGQILLARGDWRPGWIEYEWRNKLEMARDMTPAMNAPVWNGMAHPAGRILLVADQGFGDAIQFARYIPMVAARCKEVLLGCTETLKPVLGSIAGVGRMFHVWAEIPSFTSYALLSSLPYIFGTDVNSIPAEVPYIRADPAKAVQWGERLVASNPGARRVGFFWSGRPEHPNNARRSVSLERFRPLLEIAGLQLISLQKEIPTQERAALAAMPSVLDYSSALADFGETAALISNLDLVITVDSAVGHLTGALGRPVWMITPTPADWRWLLDRVDTPWYPTMRLFRQPRAGAWDEAFAAAFQELRGGGASLTLAS